MKILLERGADVKKRDDNGNTALSNAVMLYKGEGAIGARVRAFGDVRRSIADEPGFRVCYASFPCSRQMHHRFFFAVFFRAIFFRADWGIAAS